MKNFFNSLITLFLFLLTAACFYAAFTVTYPIAFINIALVIIAIFILIHACSRIDKALHLGKYANQDDKD